MPGTDGGKMGRWVGERYGWEGGRKVWWKGEGRNKAGGQAGDHSIEEGRGTLRSDVVVVEPQLRQCRVGAAIKSAHTE